MDERRLHLYDEKLLKRKGKRGKEQLVLSASKNI